MKCIREGVIRTTLPNLHGKICVDCHQLAYRIMVVRTNEVDREVPLCTKHYLQACDTQPVLGMQYRSAKVGGGG